MRHALRRPRPRCCAPPRCGPTRWWCPATRPTPPTPVCWPRQSDESRPPRSGSFAAGGATRIRVRDQSRAAGKRAHSIGPGCGRAAPPVATTHWPWSGTRPSELDDLAETAATDAERLLANAKHALRRARTKATALKVSRTGPPAAGGDAWPRAIDDPWGPGHRDPADHRADQTAAGRADPERSHPAGQPARPATPGPSPRDGSANRSSSDSAWKQPCGDVGAHSVTQLGYTTTFGNTRHDRPAPADLNTDAV